MEQILPKLIGGPAGEVPGPGEQGTEVASEGQWLEGNEEGLGKTRGWDQKGLVRASQG